MATRPQLNAATRAWTGPRNFPTTAAAIGQALREFSNGGLRVETKVGAGELIACLYTLRQVALEEQVDFNSAARVYGEQVLRERCGSDVVLRQSMLWSRR